MNETIADLERSYRTQGDIDVAFDGWCVLVRNQMYEQLPYTSVTVGINNKKRRPGKRGGVIHCHIYGTMSV